MIGIGIDVGSRHLGVHMCLMDGRAESWPPKRGQWPLFRELYKANVDLDAVTPEIVIANFVSWSRTPSVREQFVNWLPMVQFVAVERQIGGSVTTVTNESSGAKNSQTSGNPRMVAISHALQCFFLLHCTRKGFVFRFVNHSQTEPLFEKQFNLAFPHETKRRGKALSVAMSAHRQYQNRKLNSQFLAECLYRNNTVGSKLPMPSGVRAIDVYEAMIMYFTFLFRYVATRVPKPRKRKRKDEPQPEPKRAAPAARAVIDIVDDAFLPSDAFAETAGTATWSFSPVVYDGFEPLSDMEI